MWLSAEKESLFRSCLALVKSAVIERAAILNEPPDCERLSEHSHTHKSYRNAWEHIIMELHVSSFLPEKSLIMNSY